MSVILHVCYLNFRKLFYTKWRHLVLTISFI